jgi:hypothetical protein
VLAGCAAPATISNISDSALTVTGNARTPLPEVEAKAREGCGLYGKSATPISRQCYDQYCVNVAYLFACR